MVGSCVSTLLIESTYGPIRGEAVLQASEAILQGFVESGSPAAALVDHFPFCRCQSYVMPQLTIESYARSAIYSLLDAMLSP